MDEKIARLEKEIEEQRQKIWALEHTFDALWSAMDELLPDLKQKVMIDLLHRQKRAAQSRGLEGVALELARVLPLPRTAD